MPISEEPSPGRNPHAEGSLLYYKSQYEQLEAELSDFQASSKELEAELEKDVEAAERRERQLQERVEALGYEVEEWKVSRYTIHSQDQPEHLVPQAPVDLQLTYCHCRQNTSSPKQKLIQHKPPFRKK